MSAMSRPPHVDLNLNVRGLGQSATLAINERSAALQRQGRQIFRLGLGQSPFPVPAPVVEELKANAHQKDYLPVCGLWKLREAVAEYFRRTQEIDASPEGVIIGPGSKELMFLTQLVYYGDLVIPTPSWVSYAPQAQIIGRQVHWLPTSRDNDWRLTAAELASFCAVDPGRPRLLILNYPNNPTGSTYRAEELEALAEVARRYSLVLLSDEIYGEVDFEGRHLSMARFYPEGTILSSGLSKWCGAGGWRLGVYMIPPGLAWLRDAISAVASETYTSTSAPIQYAAVRAFEGGLEIEAYLEQSRRVLKALGSWTGKKLREVGAQVAMPQGGFYLFPDLSPFAAGLAERGIHDSPTLVERLLEETGVAVLPGTVFGRPQEELTLRLAVVDFNGAGALAGVQKLGSGEVDEAFLAQYCPNVVTAIERLCEWVHGEGPANGAAR
jgi:aspartate aminotransferase